MEELGAVQMDPVRPVARTEQLVLWSRLGSRFRPAELEQLLWEERSLFEYWAFIVPRSSFGVHRETMRRYPNGPGRTPARRAKETAWLKTHASIRREVLRRLRAEGPLRTRDFTATSLKAWKGGGWSDERSISLMLESLWAKGEVMLVGREHQERVWDLAERRLPLDEPRLPAREVARRILDTQLRALGVASTKQFGWAFDGRPPGWERALAELVRDGRVVPAHVEGQSGEWFAHAEVLARPWRPRTVLLSPFDQLVHDRDRVLALFDFFYRLEMYVPPAKRQYGYYVLPILHGDRLIGRVDPLFDRKTGVFTVKGAWAESGAPAAAGPAIAAQIRDLAGWVGAGSIELAGPAPAAWKSALKGLGP
ncbi:MAG: uncharacterized protein QOG88_1575 [Actinomycetota bacterium]|nr:uncharacterized protein [Actinomycetota bacterium]